MVRKRNRTKYTAEQKYKYHSQRRYSSNNSGDASYSEGWVDGFLSRDSKSSVETLQRFYEKNKKDLSPSKRAEYAGRINGGKAALRDPEVSKKIVSKIYSED